MGFDDTLLGSARVRIRPDMDGFEREANRKISASMKSAAKVAATAAGAAVAVGGAMVVSRSLSAASDLEQAVGALTAVFGPATAAMTDHAKAAKDIGLSQAQYSQSAAVLGAQLKNLGVEQSALAPTTDGLMKSAADMAAMFGGTTADAVDAVSSLMRGERDPIERYGISMSEASIQAEMAATGFDKTQATLSLLNKQLTASGTGGAAAREFDSAAASSQRMQAQIENAASTIGTALLPIFAQVASAVGDFAERHGPAFATAMAQVAGYVREDLMPALQDLGEWLRDNVLPILQDVGGFLKDHTEQLVPLAAAVVAVYGAWKVYSGIMAGVAFARTAFAITTQTAAWVANTASLAANKIAWVISQGLYAAQVVGIGAVTLAQWALNAALTANPIGLVVAAIGALIAGFVLLYKNNEGFRELVQKVWAAIKTAIGGVIEWFTTWVPAAFERAKEIIGTIMDAIGTVIRVVWEAISWYVTTYVTIVRTVVETVFNVVRTIIETVMGVISTVIRTAWEAISWYVTTYVNVVKAVVEFVFNAVSAYVGWIMGVISSVISTVWETITGVWSRGADIVRGITEAVMTTAHDLFFGGLDRIKGLFSGAVDAIGAIWTRVTDVVKAPIRGMFEWINQNMIGPINTVLGKFSDSVKIDTLPLNFADGGPVRGPGGPRSDSIPARLSNGEFVHTAPTYRRFGPLIDAIHAAGSGFGIGGPGVAAQITGWLRGQGMGNAGIAGILGNFQAESSLNPGAIEGGNGEGHGLAQWSFERKQQLFDFAASRGTGWDDLGTQLAFFAGELGAYPDMWQSLLTIADPVAASQLFANTFERPGFYGARDEHAASFFADLESGALNEESGSSIVDRVVAKARSMIRAALEGVANPALDALGSTFGGTWGPDLVIGMMKHAVGQMAAWAGARDSAANAAGPVVGGPFLGTPGAIGYPLNPWVVTSEFGMRNGVPHQGIDLGAPLGQAVMAAAAGSVARSGWYGGYGNSIMLDHGGGLATTYSHLSDLIATAGQIVSAGEVIGRVGSTGDSTGPHLHFETLSGGGFVNPREFLAFDRGGYLPTGVSAVYNGTGSPEPVFTDRQWQTMGAGQSGGPTINITNIYPQAEPTSVTTSRALRQYSMVGGL